MKYHIARSLIMLVVAVGGLMSCNSSDPGDPSTFFTTHDPSSDEYHRELARQLRATDLSSITYTFERYEKIDGNDCIVVDIVADDFTAIATMRVESWDGLESIRATKGQGFSGAELKDLTFEIREGPPGTEFVYSNVGAIID